MKMFCSLIAAYFDAAAGRSAETAEAGEVFKGGLIFCVSLIKSRTASGQNSPKSASALQFNAPQRTVRLFFSCCCCCLASSVVVKDSLPHCRTCAG